MAPGIVIVIVISTVWTILSAANQIGVYKESGQFIEAELIPRNPATRLPLILSDMAQKLKFTFVDICDR